MTVSRKAKKAFDKIPREGGDTTSDVLERLIDVFNKARRPRTKT